ncbi:hypothetical protein JCM16138_20750 [Thermococcus atlanticus]
MGKAWGIREYLGKILPAGILLVSYNQYSLGWKIGAKLAREELENGGFAILSNVGLPFRKFRAMMMSAGIDIIKEGKNGRLAVINLFKEDSSYEFVYNLGDVDESTFIPKYVEAKKQLVKRYELKGRNIIHIFWTLDTLYERFGAEITKDLFLARLYAGERLVKEGYTFWDVLIVNRDSMPHELHSWMTTVSDYVIITKGILKENEFVENIAITKSLSEDFKPLVFQMRTPTILVPPDRIY